jgi:hypothetical protein
MEIMPAKGGGDWEKLGGLLKLKKKYMVALHVMESDPPGPGVVFSCNVILG